MPEISSKSATDLQAATTDYVCLRQRGDSGAQELITPSWDWDGAAIGLGFTPHCLNRPSIHYYGQGPTHLATGQNQRLGPADCVATARVRDRLTVLAAFIALTFEVRNMAQIFFVAKTGRHVSTVDDKRNDDASYR